MYWARNKLKLNLNIHTTNIHAIQKTFEINGTKYNKANNIL